jgi:hypothetical protein
MKIVLQRLSAYLLPFSDKKILPAEFVASISHSEQAIIETRKQMLKHGNLR